MDIELKAKDHPELIGKRAKFKNELSGYVHGVWNKKGVIETSERTPYLYLRFNEPYKTGIDNSMVTESLVICAGSIILEDETPETHELEEWVTYDVECGFNILRCKNRDEAEAMCDGHVLDNVEDFDSQILLRIRGLLL